MIFLKKYFHPVKFYKTLSVPAKAGIWFLVCTVMQKGISAITTPIFTRMLTTAEYGDVSIYYAWADMISIFITFGLSSTVYSRGLIKNDDRKKEYTSIMISLAIITAGISLFVYLLFHNWINKFMSMTTVAIVSIYIYVLFNTITEFWYQEKRVSYEYKAFVYLTIILTIIKPITSIVTISLFPVNKVEARILPDVIISAIVGIILMNLMMKQGKKVIDIPVWKESMIFVLPLIPHYLSQRILNQSDRIMIKNMIGSKEAGIYSLAYSVGMLLTLLNTAMNNTVSPWAFRKMKDGDCKIVGRLCEHLLVFFGLCVVSFSLIAPELVKVFASSEYYEAIYIVPIIAISSYYMFMYVLFINFEYYSGKTKYVMIATIASAIINLVLNLIFIKQFGYIAAAYTTLFCYILYALGHYWLMKYICKKFMNVTDVFRGEFITIVSFVFSISSIFCILLYNTMWIRMFVFVVVLIFTLMDAAKVFKEFGVKK